MTIQGLFIQDKWLNLGKKSKSYDILIFVNPIPLSGSGVALKTKSHIILVAI